MKTNGTLTTTSQTQQFPPWMAQLRAAVDSQLKSEDLSEIARVFVEKAKKGDEKAAKFVIEYLLGGKLAPQQVTVHNHYHDNEPRSVPNHANGNGSRLPAPAADETQTATLDADRRTCERIHDLLATKGRLSAGQIAANLALDVADVERATQQHPWFKRRKGVVEIA